MKKKCDHYKTGRKMGGEGNKYVVVNVVQWQTKVRLKIKEMRRIRNDICVIKLENCDVTTEINTT